MGDSGIVDGAVKTTSKIVETIANPVLIFLIVITAAMLGVMAWIWHSQRVEAIEAYTHLVDVCLPTREKN
jgi:hypothetical protein